MGDRLEGPDFILNCNCASSGGKGFEAADFAIERTRSPGDGKDFDSAGLGEWLVPRNFGLPRSRVLAMELFDGLRDPLSGRVRDLSADKGSGSLIFSLVRCTSAIVVPSGSTTPCSIGVATRDLLQYQNG